MTPNYDEDGEFDVSIELESSITFFHLLSDKARQWVEQNLPKDSLHFEDCVAVERKNANWVAQSMADGDLKVRFQ